MSKKAAKKTVKKAAKKAAKETAKKIAKKAVKKVAKNAAVQPQSAAKPIEGTPETPSLGKDLSKLPPENEGIPQTTVNHKLESKLAIAPQSPSIKVQAIPKAEIKSVDVPQIPAKPKPSVSRVKEKALKRSLTQIPPYKEDGLTGKTTQVLESKPVIKTKLPSQVQHISKREKKPVDMPQTPAKPEPHVPSEKVMVPMQKLTPSPLEMQAIPARTQISIEATLPITQNSTATPKSKVSKLSIFKKNFLHYRIEIIKILKRFGWITAIIGGGIVLAMGIAGMASYGSAVTNPNFGYGIVDVILGCWGVVAGVFEKVLILPSSSQEKSTLTIKMGYIWTFLGCACYGVGVFIFLRIFITKSGNATWGRRHTNA